MIEMESNLLVEFVELLGKYGDLSYCNVLCGVIRGALETVRVRTTCAFESDFLRGEGE